MRNFRNYSPRLSVLAGDTPALRRDDGSAIEGWGGGLLFTAKSIAGLMTTPYEEEFWNFGYSLYLKSIQGFREMFLESGTSGLTYAGDGGEAVEPDWTLVENAVVLRATYSLAVGKGMTTELVEFYGSLFCFACLEEIDTALGCRNSLDEALHAGIAVGESMAMARELLARAEAVRSNARRGGDTSNGPMRAVRDHAIKLYRSGKFPSANKAAIVIGPAVAKFAAEIGSPLSADRARKTIYEWLLKSNKDK